MKIRYGTAPSVALAVALLGGMQGTSAADDPATGGPSPAVGSQAVAANDEVLSSTGQRASTPEEAAAANRAAASAPRATAALKPVNPGMVKRAADQGLRRSVVTSGVLRDADGKPLSGVKLRADLEPTRAAQLAAGTDAGAELAKLDEAVTDGQGRFVFKASALGDMSGYVEDDGSVSVLVTSTKGEHNLMYHLTAFPDPAGRAPWNWKNKDSKVADDSQVDEPTRHAARGLGRGNGAIGVKLTDKNANPEAPPGSDERGFDGYNGADGCYSYETYYWVRIDSPNQVIFTNARLQRAYNQSRMVQWKYDWTNTNTNSVDSAANLGAGGALVAAGYVSVQTDANGTTFTRGTNQQADASVNYDNRPYNLYCSWAGSSRYSGKYEWRPFSWTGGTSYAALNTPVFTCNYTYRVKIATPVWLSQDATRTMQYSYGSSLGGVNLRTISSVGSGYKITYTPGSVGAYLCGHGGYPVQVAQAREQQ